MDTAVGNFYQTAVAAYPYPTYIDDAVTYSQHKSPSNNEYASEKKTKLKELFRCNLDRIDQSYSILSTMPLYRRARLTTSLFNFREGVEV